MWRLGGKKSDFKLGSGVRFDWQHSIRVLPNGDYGSTTTRAAPPVRKASRAITVRLDEQAKTATLVSAFKHPRGLLSASQGNVETLPNGNLFVGWGSQRWFTEFSPTGQVVFDGRIARGNDNYRAFRYPWTGTPATPPKVVASADGGKVTARVSWNGATKVARWELLAGADAEHARAGRPGGQAGFETAVTAKRPRALVALRGYDAAGERARRPARRSSPPAERCGAALAAGGAVALLAAARRLRGGGLAFPLPGTRPLRRGPRSASAAPRRTAIGEVRVTGSRSGRHGGRLRAHSDGNGASFVVSTAVPAGRAGAPVRLARARPTASIGRRPRRSRTRPASCRASAAAACSAPRRARTSRRPRSPSPA